MRSRCRVLSRSMTLAACAGFGVSLASPAWAGPPPRFQPLGNAGNDFAVPRAISADGSIVAGDFSSQFGAAIAGRWLFPGPQIVSIGAFQGQGTSVSVLTRDGGTVYGRSAAGAFRWSTPGPSVADPAGNTVDITPDGAVRIVSNARQEGGDPPESLGVPPGYESAHLVAIDASGDVIVGDGVFVEEGGGYRARGAQEFREAARWTRADGWQNLGFLPGDAHSQAFDVSDDGTIIVGVSRSSDGATPRTFRLVLPGVMTDLGSLPGLDGFGVEPRGMSADGQVIVGRIDTSPTRLFVWTPQDGMRDLEAILRASGQDLDTWRLLSVEALSSDGRYVAGSAISPGGDFAPYIAPIFAMCAPPVLAEADTYEPLLEVGQTLPSLPGAPSVSGLAANLVSAARGEFWSARPSLSDQAVNARSALVVGGPATPPTEVARIDGPAPGPGGDGTFSDLFQHVIKQDGNTAILGKFGPRPTLADPSSGPVAIWSGPPNALAQITRVGGTLLGRTVLDLQGPIFHNNDGRTAFIAFFDGSFTFISAGPGVAQGYFLSAGTVAAFPAGASFIEPRLLALTDGGLIALSEKIASPAVPAGADSCIMVRSVGQTTNQVRALEGSVVPGLAPGVVMGDLLGTLSVSLNESGRMALAAPVSSGGRAIFAESSNGLGALAYESGPAPGMPASSTISSLFDPVIDADGRTLFVAMVDLPGGSRESVLYAAPRDEAPAPLFRAVGLAPGLPVCSELTGLDPSLVVNEHGQVLFAAVIGAGGGAVERDVIYLHDPARGLRLIAAPNQTMSRGGLARTTAFVDRISAPVLSGSTTDGRDVALSDDGDVVFKATFTDGGQAYVRARVVPPAPPLTCAGDADKNGSVTFLDITTVLANFGTVYGPPGTGDGDADRNGAVQFLDITTVLANFGTACR